MGQFPGEQGMMERGWLSFFCFKTKNCNTGSRISYKGSKELSGSIAELDKVTSLAEEKTQLCHLPFCEECAHKHTCSRAGMASAGRRGKCRRPVTRSPAEQIERKSARELTLRLANVQGHETNSWQGNSSSATERVETTRHSESP